MKSKNTMVEGSLPLLPSINNITTSISIARLSLETLQLESLVDIRKRSLEESKIYHQSNQTEIWHRDLTYVRSLSLTTRY